MSEQKTYAPWTPERAAEIKAAPTCECGCGRPTRINKWTERSKGWVKGQPRRFALGHDHRTGKSPTSRNNYLTKKVGGKYRPTHLHIAEAALGRPIPKGVQVHHFDENKHNNSPSNLVICQDQAYHRLLHVRQRVKAFGGDPNTQRICGRGKHLARIEDMHGRCCRECSRKIAQKRRMAKRESECAK